MSSPLTEAGLGDFYEPLEMRTAFGKPGRPIGVRTLNNYERAGLPFVLVGGRKIYPKEGAQKWLRDRERRRNEDRRRRRG
jgi:hypothetical protein